MVEDLQTRESFDGDSVHVINIDIQDNHEEATIGALFVCELCSRVCLVVFPILHLFSEFFCLVG